MAPTIEKLMEGVNIHKKHWNHVDVELWSTTPTTNSDSKHLTTEAVRFIKDNLHELSSDEVLCNFRNDFEWTVETLNKVHKPVLKELKRFFRYKGWYTGPDGQSIATQLATLWSGDGSEEMEWPEAEFRAAKFAPGTDVYQRQQALLNQPSKPAQPSTPQTATVTVDRYKELLNSYGDLVTENTKLRAIIRDKNSAGIALRDQYEALRQHAINYGLGPPPSI